MKPKFLNRFASRSSSLALAAAIAMGITSSAKAASYYWDTNSTTSGFGSAAGTWGTDADWSTSSTGVATPTAYTTTVSDTLYFGTDASTYGYANGGTATVTINGSQNANNLFFGSQSGAITLSGGTQITLGGTTPTITVNNAADTISTKLVGTAGLAKAGTGTLTLDQNNSFTGDVNFTSGTIIAKNSGAVGTGTKKVVMNNGNSVFKLDGSGGDLTFANTITFQTAGLQAGGTIVNVAGNNAINGPITLNSGAGGTAIQVDGGTLALAGNISIGAGTRSLSLQGAGNGTASGVINVNGGVSKNGTGTWTLTGANTYSSGTTINGGTLVANRSNNTLNPTASALGNPQSAQNITVGNGGTLQFYAGDTLGGSTSTPVATLVIQSGGIVTNNGNNFTTLGPVSLTGGTLTGTGGAITGYQMYNFAGTVTASNNATSTISGSGTYAGYHLNTNTTFQVDSGSTLNVSGILIDRYNSTGSGGFTKTGVGTMTLSGANTYTGATTVQAGSLVAGVSDGTGTGAFGNTTSAIVLGNGTTGASDAPSLLINGAFTVGRAITVGSLSDTNAYNATIGGSNTSGTSTYTGSITLNTTATNYTVTLQAATSGTVEFKTGTWTTSNKQIVIGSSGNTGIVKLSNSLSTTGGINVNFGTLLLGSSSLITNTTPVTVAGGIFDTGTALTDTVSTFAMSSGSLNGTGTITATTYGLSGGTVTANLGTGTITANSGTTALNGTAAATIINIGGGTLTLGSGGRLASGAAVTLSSGGLTLGGAESISSYTQSGGTLTGAYTLTSASDYAMQAGTVSANLGGSVGLNKTTGGTLSLNGANGYSGVTTISGGTLALGGGSTNNIASSTSIIVGDSSAHSSAVLNVTGLSGSTLALNGSQTLGGHGTVTGKVSTTTGSQISPGNGVGTLTVGSLAMNSGSIFDWELASNKDSTTGTRGTDYDAVNVNGTGTGDGLAISSAAVFKILLGTNFDSTNAFWKTTETWNVFNVAGVKSDTFQIFKIYNASAPTSEVTYSSFGSFSYTYSSNTGYLTWTAVPEPTSALVGLLIGAGMLRRRRTVG